jgi:hypothetical protein
MRQCIILVALCGLAAAYIPSSFRLQSTAGVWPDDYDLLFEPARIPLINGSRVYTGLSNFVTGAEEQFGAARSNFIFVGGSTSLSGPIFPGLLYDRWAERTPLFTGLVPVVGESLFGEGQTINTELVDLDSNGTYDYKSTTVNKAKAWDEQSEADYHVGVGFRTGSLRLGAAYTRNDFDYSAIYPSDNFSTDVRDSNLVSGRLTFAGFDTAAGTWDLGQSLNRFTLNAWYDAAPLHFGLLGAYTLIDQWEPYRRAEDYWADYSPSDPLIVDHVRQAWSDSTDRPASGNRIGGMLSVFHVPTEHVESRYYVSAYTQTLGVAEAAGGLYTYQSDSLTHPGNDTSMDTVRYGYGGRYAVSNLEVKTRQLFRVSERFRVGFGLGFSMGASQDSLTDAESERSYFSHDNGDTIAGAEDYRTVETWSETWLDRVTRSDNVLSAPVGLEFNVFNPLVLRLGVNPQITWHGETTTHQLVASSPTHTRTDYGDGSYSESIGPGPSDPDTRESITSTTYSSPLTYGLGYSPVENLQIDLMGFAKLTDLTNWRLSATLKF